MMCPIRSAVRAYYAAPMTTSGLQHEIHVFVVCLDRNKHHHSVSHTRNNDVASVE